MTTTSQSAPEPGAPDGSAAAGLQVTDVSAAYGGTVVLRDINLRIEAGTIATLLGPNGAGKTTLLRVIAGQLAAKSGEVRVGGKDVTRMPVHKRVRDGVCLVPEGSGVFPSLTVAENLRLQIPPWAEEASIEPALDVFPALKDRLRSPAGKLSGGQQRMVAISRPILTRPRVVLLDEISMGLAPLVVDEIYEALQVLTDRGVTLLVVEQFVGKALSLAGSAHLISRGQVTFSGPAAQLDEDAVVQGYLGHGAEIVPGPSSNGLATS